MRRLAVLIAIVSIFQLSLIGWSQNNSPASGPSTQAMDDATLLRLCRNELGGKTVNDKLLLATHDLIEAFFARPTERKRTLASLETLAIDPNIVGRIARVRRSWSDLAGGSVLSIDEKVGPHSIQYFVGLPNNYTRERSWPLVIQLATIDDFAGNAKPSADLIAMRCRQSAEDELRKHPDAIVLVPLPNADEFYGPGYAGMNAVIQSLHHAMDRFNIDPARIDLVGQSLSANAVWNLSLHDSIDFAAFSAFAGSATQEFQRVRMMNLRNTLPVIWHDTKDSIVKVEMARELVRILHAQKLDVDYTETKNLGHDPSVDIVEQLYSKMRSRSRERYPKRVSIQSDRPDPIFNRADWVQIDQPMNGGDEKWLLLNKGRSHMVIYDRPFKVDATLSTPNHIEAMVDNVQTVRLYLNDQMIDFSRPVTVSVNHKPMFEGVVKPSIAIVMNDQLFLGRGVRYFSAAVSIDLAPPASTRPAVR